MNLIFHDRTTTAQQHTGLAFLTIEKAGSFVFSAAAVAGAQLLIGSAVALAQDTDSNIWYLVTSPRTQDVAMPFTLRSSGTNNGGRLCFSSAQRAKAFLAAHGESRASIRLVVGSTPMEHDGQRLWPLTFTSPAAITPAAKPAVVKPAVVIAAVKEITLPPALTQLTAKSVENEQIHPGLEAKFLKLVAKLGPMKLFKMDPHEAKQALLLLTNNLEKLILVPGAEVLRERLAGCFTLPTQKMEGSVGRG